MIAAVDDRTDPAPAMNAVTGGSMSNVAPPSVSKTTASLA